MRLLLTQVLVQQQAPDARSAALIALVHALRCEHQIVDPRPYRLSKRQLGARQRKSPRATGHLRPSATRSPRSSQRWPLPPPPRPRPAGANTAVCAAPRARQPPADADEQPGHQVSEPSRDPRSRKKLCWSASYGLRLLQLPHGPRPLIPRPVAAPAYPPLLSSWASSARRSSQTAYATAASTVTPAAATPAPVPAPDNGSTSMKISTAPKPMPQGQTRRRTPSQHGWRPPDARPNVHGPPRLRIGAGPFVLNGEHRQCERDHQKARPECHQQHHANSQAYRAHHDDSDPAEQPDQVLHVRKLGNARRRTVMSGDTR